MSRKSFVLLRKTIANVYQIGYTLCLSEITYVENRKKHMPHSEQVAFEDSITNALNVLYERKARGTSLIQVLEDYRRLRQAHKTWPLTCRVASQHTPSAPQQELERLRMRRAAVDQVIRSIEAYSRAKASATALR
jgi:hypothetical protein